MFDASHLWWPAFAPLYDDLSHPMKTSIEDVGRVLQANRHKLMSILSFFQTPQSRTTDIIASNANFELDYSLPVDPRRLHDSELCELALQASSHLNLDAVQSYFLILHFQDANFSPSSKTKKLAITMDQLQSFYFKERLHLLKCLELMIQDGEASPFWSVTTTMVDENLDVQVANNISENLRYTYEGLPSTKSTNSKPPTADGSRSHAGTSTSASRLDRDAWMNEGALELGNLLDILLAIWDDPTLQCPCSIWLKMADTFERYLFHINTENLSTELKRTLPRAQDLAALVLVHGLHLEDMLQQMYSADGGLEGNSLFGRNFALDSPRLSSSYMDMGNSRRSRRPQRSAASASWRGSYTPRGAGVSAFTSDERFKL